MRSLNSIFVKFLPVLWCCCCTGIVDDTGYSIEGKISGVADGTKIYLFDMRNQQNIDSAEIEDGYFFMQGAVDRPLQCYLRFPDSKQYAGLIVENTNIQFESVFEDMYLESKVEGGDEQRLQNELLELTRRYDRIYLKVGDSLTNGLYQNEDHKNKLIEAHRKHLNKSLEEMRGFIIENPNSYFTLDLLFRNRKHIAHTALKNCLSKLDSKYADSSDAQALSRYLDEGEGQLAKDSVFIDFEASDITGKSFRLSSLKGDYIYLSFWNTGCGPCRQENRFFSENYDQLPDNLKLVSFSTDKVKEQWVKASEQDNIKWANVSDLGGNKGDVATSYGVVALPNSYLIGKDGRIIEHFVGYEENTYQQILHAIASKD